LRDVSQRVEDILYSS
jgi:hypothetical protein